MLLACYCGVAIGLIGHVSGIFIIAWLYSMYFFSTVYIHSSVTRISALEPECLIIPVLWLSQTACIYYGVQNIGGQTQTLLVLGFQYLLLLLIVSPLKQVVLIFCVSRYGPPNSIAKQILSFTVDCSVVLCPY